MAAVALGLATQASAYTTFAESFGNSSASNWTLSGTAVLTAPSIDTAGNGWLRLTDAANGGIGYAYYSQSIPTNQPVSVDFDFAMSAGSSPPADGTTFFLYDSTVAFSGGAGGGTFGYMCCPGLAGGALAVGISAGYPSSFVNGVANSIAIAGPQPSYAFITGSGALNPTPYAGARGLAPSDPNFRHLHIEMTPTATVGQLSLTVAMQAGTTTTTVLNSVVVSGLPANVNFGLSAATGGNVATMEVRNFRLQSGAAPIVPSPGLSALGRLLLLVGLLAVAAATLAARRRSA
ncbi:MAG: hypothetical protein JSS28_04820 [Proteobacteria bacterium]|nr:hypothetical protein [Pseudomonadota bacterium]